MYKHQQAYIDKIKSLNTQNPQRRARMLKDYVEKGYCEFEMWCLATTVSKFILPRLKDFKEIVRKDKLRRNNYPASLKDFNSMIYSFQKIVDNEHILCDEKEQIKIQKGLDLFSQNLTGMWH